MGQACRGQEGSNTEGNKRKRFTDEQLAGLQKLAAENNWSLPSVSKEDRDKFCEKFNITRVWLTPCAHRYRYAHSPIAHHPHAVVIFGVNFGKLGTLQF
jgi:hypothetical protein